MTKVKINYEEAFREFRALNSRYKFIRMDEDYAFNDPSKEKISELLFWADWEIEQVVFNSDDIIDELEDAGRSPRQIQDMQERARKALNAFIYKWNNGKPYTGN